MIFDQVKFGDRIRQLRKAKDMIQEDLAPELHISLEHLKKLECGNRRASYEVLVIISIYFDVSIDYLITGRDHLSSQTRMKIQNAMMELASVTEEMA